MLSDEEIADVMNRDIGVECEFSVEDVQSHDQAIAQAQDKATREEIAEWLESKNKSMACLTYLYLAAELRKVVV